MEESKLRIDPRRTVQYRPMEQVLQPTTTDRLLRRDIERRESIPNAITHGSRSGFKATYPTGGTPARADLPIGPGNTFSFIYDGYANSPTSYDLQVELNLEAVPLILVWYLGAEVREKGSPDVLDEKATLLTSTPTTLPGAGTTAEAYWGKDTLTVLIEQDGSGGVGTDNTEAFFKFAVYYDDNTVVL